MSGSLGQTGGSQAKKKIKLVDVTDKTITQIEDTFNNNWGSIGWRFMKVIILGSSQYLLMEKEY